MGMLLANYIALGVLIMCILVLIWAQIRRGKNSFALSPLEPGLTVRSLGSGHAQRRSADKSGSLAMFTAIGCASSQVRSFVADLRPDR
jgi:hypothetical protein